MSLCPFWCWKKKLSLTFQVPLKLTKSRSRRTKTSFSQLCEISGLDRATDAQRVKIFHRSSTVNRQLWSRDSHPQRRQSTSARESHTQADFGKGHIFLLFDPQFDPGNLRSPPIQRFRWCWSFLVVSQRIHRLAFEWERTSKIVDGNQSCMIRLISMLMNDFGWRTGKRERKWERERIKRL